MNNNNNITKWLSRIQLVPHARRRVELQKESDGWIPVYVWRMTKWRRADVPV